MNYKETLNIPYTEFPMQAKLSRAEPEILHHWLRLDVYALARRNAKGRPKFILHDGPPYANGDIHIGHALNKILKDFVVKYKIMRGFDVPFVPGWDCHGLPVEHQLFKELGITKHEIGRGEFRRKAKDFALRFVDIQREQFKRLGLIADWQRPYLTLDFAYEAEIIRTFAKLVKGKYIYHGLKPINWCVSCETALAEAEVEYEDRRSPSIYVKFKLVNQKNGLPSAFKQLSSAQLDKTFFLIWTTTPWTLISNVAVAVHPEFNYSLVAVSYQNKDKAEEILILVDGLADRLMQQMQIKDYRKIGNVKGSALENLHARHPFFSRQARLVLAEYVSKEEGTGCVHTAPGHGQEDYLTGLKYKLPILMPVDGKGRFDETCGEFSGTQVFTANQLVIDTMENNNTLVFASDVLHSYPHCWRCRSPLITRSTKQWFLNVENKDLRKKSLREIKKVQWTPPSGENRIFNMVQVRPDWCLSRQRYWGVPIPAFYCRNCSKEILRADLIEQVAQAVEKEGCDVWFTKSAEELLGKRASCPVCRSKDLSKEEDIIDVWFDSGVSHQAVLNCSRDLAFPASLYLEGSDQHRGWFQTSLLTSIPLTNKPPYRAVLTHGFVVDAEGRKMSKSKGNVISPQEVITDYGAEILRLWVASCDYTDDVRISGQILSNTVDAYRKIRNTIRFLLANLYDFSPEHKVKYTQLWEIDRWALSSLARLLLSVDDDFEHFRYYKLFRRLYNFCVQEMSSFYLDVLKDRLYTFGKDSPGRRSAQTAICEILTSLIKVLAPILSFTAEQAWSYLCVILKIEDTPSVILSSWPKIERKWINPSLDEKMQELSKLRAAVLKAIEKEREKGLIRSSLQARVRLYASEDKLFKFLKENQELLASIFIVSDVLVERVSELSQEALLSSDLPNLAVRAEKIDLPKCQRCWNHRSSVGKDKGHPQLCQRCIAVLEK